MKSKKRVRDGAVYIPLCMTDGEAVCEEMIPDGHCRYSDVCRENNASLRLIGKITNNKGDLICR